MTPETLDLLEQAVEALKRHVLAGDCPAVVALGGSRRLTVTDFDYLRSDADAASFEQRAAVKALEVQAPRWVIAVPQVRVIAANAVSVRPVSNLPLRPGESEAITWMAFDAADGVDYGQVPITRRPEVAFGDIEIVMAQARPTPAMPGYTLLRRVLGDEGQDDTKPGATR